MTGRSHDNRNSWQIRHAQIHFNVAVHVICVHMLHACSMPNNMYAPDKRNTYHNKATPTN